MTVRYSYIKILSVEFFSENYSYSYTKNGFRTINVMISKRMVIPGYVMQCVALLNFLEINYAMIPELRVVRICGFSSLSQ